ncbi:MAG: ABC transporter permease [Oscillochloridaceae bacterium]|nr:ABC transporter permease [Chloroflexaceae bacterium]MDW8389690.1 ABC transporter permease [Oscillochloridaceae bacterium]
MLAQLLARISGGLLALWLVSLLAFGLMALAPGEPARLLLIAEGVTMPTPELVAAKRAELRLDDPLPARYLHWLSGALRGDFGACYRSGRPVWAIYSERFPATLMLAGLTLALSLAVALPLGLIAAIRRGSVLDALLQALAVLGAAAPGFWVALILMLVFAATLRWLPALGSPTLAGMLLPAITLALPNVAVLSRLVRAATLDVLGQPFMVTAQAKGYSSREAVWRHGLPNVWPAVVTAITLEAAYLLTGTVIIETVFAYPGVGRLAVDAALLGNMPVLALCVLMAAGIYVLGNWLADLLMFTLDPRVRSI